MFPARGINQATGKAENEIVRLLAVFAAALFLASPGAAAPVPLPAAPDCPLFPDTNVWNKPVGKLPLRSNSRKEVRAIGARLPVHADFGSGLWEGAPIGIPITVVDDDRVPVAVRAVATLDRNAVRDRIRPRVALVVVIEVHRGRRLRGVDHRRSGSRSARPPRALSRSRRGPGAERRSRGPPSSSSSGGGACRRACSRRSYPGRAGSRARPEEAQAPPPPARRGKGRLCEDGKEPHDLVLGLPRRLVNPSRRETSVRHNRP